MSNEVRTKDALLLEHFDIKELSKIYPYKEVGVKTNTVYLQIAKYVNNPQREKEIEILCKAAWLADESKNKNIRYTKMTLSDVMICFGKNLRKLPKSTFIIYPNITN